MANKTNPARGGGSAQLAESRAAQAAQELGLELVEVTLLKEPRGKVLTIYLDKEGGLSLDDCEKAHKRILPLLEDIDYDFMEVSSPGVDRPVKTRRDFEKNRGNVVEVKLFAAQDGRKLFRGTLEDFTEEAVVIADEDGAPLSFSRKAVALVKPVIELDEEDFADVSFDEENELEVEEVPESGDEQ